MTPDERKMLIAMPHRHTHRGPFEAGPLPAGLLARLRDDARAEGATLTDIDPGPVRDQLIALVAASGRDQDRDPWVRAETRRWSRGTGRSDREGVPAHTFPATPSREGGSLPQRDFDLGRGLGSLPAGGPAAPVTAVLFTPGDSEEDWLHAGQALQRLLLHAATQWVFACLNTQPLEDAATRALIRDHLGPAGSAADAAGARHQPDGASHGPPPRGRRDRAVTHPLASQGGLGGKVGWVGGRRWLGRSRAGSGRAARGP